MKAEIKNKNKVFEPIEVVFTIESEQEIIHLLSVFNISDNKDSNKNATEVIITNFIEVKENEYYTWIKKENK